MIRFIGMMSLVIEALLRWLQDTRLVEWAMVDSHQAAIGVSR